MKHSSSRNRRLGMGLFLAVSSASGYHYLRDAELATDSDKLFALQQQSTLSVRTRSRQTLARSFSSLESEGQASPLKQSLPSVTREELDDCLAIYAQHASLSRAMVLHTGANDPFLHVLEGRCRYMGADNQSHILEPPYPYDYCEGGPIEIDDDPDQAVYSLESLDLPELEDALSKGDPVPFDIEIYDDEETIQLQKCLTHYRAKAVHLLSEDAILVDSPAWQRANEYIMRGCQLKYDSDSNTLQPLPPEDFMPCLEAYPAIDLNDWDVEQKQNLVASVYEHAFFLVNSGSFEEAFKLIEPKYLRWEMESCLEGISDSNIREKARTDLDSLVRLIEDEPGDPRAVCASIYQAGPLNGDIDFGNGQPPKLLQLLYRSVMEGMGCDFDDM